jgi:hypothetical protein
MCKVIVSVTVISEKNIEGVTFVETVVIYVRQEGVHMRARVYNLGKFWVP